VTRAIEGAQKRVETRNFEIRKHLLEYDDVMNRQRELIYAERDRVLRRENIREHVFEMIDNVVEDLLGMYVHPDWRDEDKKPEGLTKALESQFGTEFASIVKEKYEDVEALREDLLEKIRQHYETREKDFTPERMTFLTCFIMLQVIDTKWKEHLNSLDALKEGIGLRAYGQRDPLKEYQKESFDLFEDLVSSIKYDTLELIFHVQTVREEKMAPVVDTSKASFVHPESQSMAAVRREAPPAPPASPLGLPRPASHSHDNRPAETVRREAPKVGRNDPCPCGSGKKYKKCHGNGSS
jgi:preprotein translocase subunit SecA